MDLVNNKALKQFFSLQKWITKLIKMDYNLCFPTGKVRKKLSFFEKGFFRYPNDDQERSYVKTFLSNIHLFNGNRISDLTSHSMKIN
ncbi:CLUMA_CG021496, isoform A [Clunio marinus]|uniref:CLUMA_CG021496, isoform A n=1 Tax=Clunio marinus TaxID=568069 RepID=A0A1J1J9B6_9DIPT|nr:CLUMA_CG021496, isoform A [Clunio marinus]